MDDDSKKKLSKTLQGLQKGKRGEKFEEYNVIRKDGEIVVAEVLGKQIFFEGKPAVLVVGKDVTERKKYEEKIKYIAYHDSLTGLPNRYYLSTVIQEAMNESISKRKKLAVLFFDLDGFKDINDTHGHEVGDDLLKQITRRILNGVRKNDTVARFGGDEFIILLKDVTVDETTLTVQRIIQSIRDPIFISEDAVTVTTSVGISLFPSDGALPETLIKHADHAMYKAKAMGKNTFEFYNSRGKQ